MEHREKEKEGKQDVCKVGAVIRNIHTKNGKFQKTLRPETIKKHTLKKHFSSRRVGEVDIG